MPSTSSRRKKQRFPFLQIRGLQTGEHFDYFTLTLGASMSRTSTESHLKMLQKMFPAWYNVEPCIRRSMGASSAGRLATPASCTEVSMSNSSLAVSNQGVSSFSEHIHSHEPPSTASPLDVSAQRPRPVTANVQQTSLDYKCHDTSGKPSIPVKTVPNKRALGPCNGIRRLCSPNVLGERESKSAGVRRSIQRPLSRQRVGDPYMKSDTEWQNEKCEQFVQDTFLSMGEKRKMRADAQCTPNCKDLDQNRRTSEIVEDTVFREIASSRQRSSRTSLDMTSSMKSPRERRGSSLSRRRRSSAIERVLANAPDASQATSYEQFFYRRRRSQIRSSDIPDTSLFDTSLHESGRGLNRFRNLVKAIRVIVAVCWSLKSYVRQKVTTHWSFYEFYLHLQKDITPVLAFDPQQFCKIEPPQGGRALERLLSIPSLQRTPAEIQKILAFVRTHECFEKFPANVQVKLCQVMQYQCYDPRTVVIKEGHIASAFYLILSGSLIVNIPQTNPRTGTTFVETVACVGRGECFGEIALLEGIRRSATLVCKSRVELLVVYKEDFDYLVLRPLLKQRDDDVDFCLSHSLFEEFPRELFEANQDHFFYQYFPTETVIISDSATCPFLILIKSGECQVVDSFEKEEVEKYQPLTNYEMENLFPLHDLIVKVSKSNGDQQDLTAQFDAMIASVLTQRRKVGHFLKQDPRKDNAPPDSEMVSRKADGMNIYRGGGKEDINSLGILKDSINANKKNEKTYVRVATLRKGSVFGLETLTKGAGHAHSVVSQGVECIMVSKEFFLQHASIKSLRVAGDLVTEYPPSSVLRKRLKMCRGWTKYKKDLINNAIS